MVNFHIHCLGVVEKLLYIYYIDIGKHCQCGQDCQRPYHPRNRKQTKYIKDFFRSKTTLEMSNYFVGSRRLLRRIASEQENAFEIVYSHRIFEQDFVSQHHIVVIRNCACFCPKGFNSLRPRPNRRHFADDIFKCIFENENEWMSPRISLKFVPKVRINNIPALVHIMAWRRPGDKPLSEPMMIISLTHICVTRPQWVKAMSSSTHV